MIGDLLPDVVATEVAYDDPPEARLEPDEEAVIARAAAKSGAKVVGKRRREFTTARHCARAALSRLGVAYRPIIPGHLGAPSWPDGVVGSLTHCDGFRAAAVAHSRDLVSVGIDAEPALPLPDDVLDVIALPGEQRRIAGLLAAAPHIPWDRILFSAKESVYKAWFPLAGKFLDFSEADLVLASDGTFSARLLVPGPRVGDRRIDGFDGRWAVRDGLLATAIAVAH
ncbi:4'-phosphopantetheinyl transferase superfamily protein [Streptomyces kaniharaensis]|uniref:4'-phosphopantetheinyl transferase superfamily protein n=1 Tax=Streptomyces kaniharaensis TaxID=212423 RepID=A0A6N7KKZ2_9ACTN|nr:4'-phosphopantetheinyl transferase superfamily protein [Streptomyces kaniharaensis]MQS11098.1 4'-phosphopantetheinyl transferase superfamily protein [Streptomyces kaniharaensis]